jgi:lanosterol synthase
VSDCTAEALAAVLEMHHVVDPAAHGHERISDNRLRDAADFILLRQNADGGFGTYENQRGPMFLEALNPSEMFSNCMIEHSYVECTASCIGALRKFREAFPEYRPTAIENAIERGIACLVAAQHKDGTWTAAWGVHFTYAICFVVEGLIGAGLPPTHPSIARAAAWLIEHQRADGGWGEHFETSLQDRYVEHHESQVLMTSWAVLALLRSHGANAAPVKRGIAWLEARQNADGSFPKESPGGVFFGTAVLDYVLYRDYFAMWALARYRSMLG